MCGRRRRCWMVWVVKYEPWEDKNSVDTQSSTEELKLRLSAENLDAAGSVSPYWDHLTVQNRPMRSFLVSGDIAQLLKFGVMAVTILVLWAAEVTIFGQEGGAGEPNEALWSRHVNHKVATPWITPCVIVYLTLNGTIIYELDITISLTRLNLSTESYEVIFHFQLLSRNHDINETRDLNDTFHPWLFSRTSCEFGTETIFEVEF